MTPAVADAASLDGTKKARLAAPVVNGDGDTEKWLDVAQSDGGRVVAVRNKPGRISNFSWFKIWEPDGSSTVEGPLNAPGGWTSYVYPLGFDIAADGKHLVYGYSNSGSCCPAPFGRGTYVRPATNSALNPIDVNQTSPSLLGSRMVALEDSTSPKIVNVQDAGTGNPYTNTFTPWLDTSSVPLDLESVDVAANGRLVALGFETWDAGTQTVGEIGLLAVQGVDQAPALPASVNCVMGSAPVALSPSGEPPSIGGADVAAFLPAPAATPPPAGPGPAAPGPAASRALVVTLPKKVTAKALATRRGVAVKVRVTRAGKVSIRARSRLGASAAAASRSSWRRARASRAPPAR